MSKSYCVYSLYFFPELTGIGKYSHEFSAFLKTNAGDVTVITGYPFYPNWQVFKGYSSKWFTKEMIDGISVYRCPIFVPQKPSGLKRMLQDFSFLFSSFFIIFYLLFRKRKFDYFFVVAPPFITAINTFFYRFFSRKTLIIYHIQDLQIDAAAQVGMIKIKWLLKVLFRIEKYILKKVNIISTISLAMINKIKEKGLDKVLLFPNWVDNKNIFKTKNTDLDIKKFTIPTNKKIIFYSGAIGEKQGLELILDVAYELKKINNDEYLFLISGVGPYKNKLIERAETNGLSNVQFIDLQEINTFNKLLNIAYFHLVLQKQEIEDVVLPSKLTNILAVGGCAIVTSKKGASLYELISQHKIGYIIPPGDISSLLNFLLEFNEQSLDYTQIKKNSLEFSNENLDKNNIISRYLDDIIKFDSN